MILFQNCSVATTRRMNSVVVVVVVVAYWTFLFFASAVASQMSAANHLQQPCLFSVRYHELSSFQVELGTIVEYDQIAGPNGEMGLCDDCKCSTMGSQSIVASVQGDCHVAEGIDVLEFTVATDDEGDLEITCPDLRYQIDYECHAWDLLTRAFSPMEDAVAPPTIELTGARLGFHIDGGYLVKCTAICQKSSLYNMDETSSQQAHQS